MLTRRAHGSTQDVDRLEDIMENIETVKAALMGEHARLMNERFPAAKTQTFWKKVSELPEDHQLEIRKLCDLAQQLKAQPHVLRR
jgi:hypothetical protein